MRLNNILLLLCFFCTCLRGQPTHTYNPLIDVEQYEFYIALDDLSNEVSATAVVTVQLLQNTNTIWLDLVGKNDQGHGMEVTAIRENGQALSFEHTANRLQINLKVPGSAGDMHAYSIVYHGVPENGLVFSKNKFGQRTIFADNWPNRARYWLPCVDHLSDKAAVDFLVTAPDHYTVISNGLLIEESALGNHKKLTHWKETVLLPTKVMVIGLADFAINNAGSVDCIPVSSWVFPEDKKNGFYDYGQAMEILPFFISHVGAYAYKKLANVEAITVFGGMENASAIFYNERSITGSRSSEELLAHEIAHQWFGNSATEAGWPQVWLSEGFATAMANLYLENKYGADTLRAMLKKDRATVIAFEKDRYTPVVDSSESENYLALLNQNSYQKGGWVLHMLRRKLGDTLFWKGIRTYYATYAGANATTDDLRKIMEDVSGMKLKDFFQQWLYTPGHPRLQITWRYDQHKKSVLLRITQQQPALFSFTLELALVNGNTKASTYQNVAINGKITTMEFPAGEKPAQIIADPFVNLLFDGAVSEEKVPVNN